jgi:adenylate cyclase
MPSIHFLPDDIESEVEENETILNAAIKAGIPLTHVCGGTARCTTCRVLVLDGVDSGVIPRNEEEARLADKLCFDPKVRLACQSRVTGNVRVRRLVLDDADIDLTILW